MKFYDSPLLLSTADRFIIFRIGWFLSSRSRFMLCPLRFSCWLSRRWSVRGRWKIVRIFCKLNFSRGLYRGRRVHWCSAICAGKGRAVLSVLLFLWSYFEHFPDVVNSTLIRSFSGVAGSSSTESSVGLWTGESSSLGDEESGVFIIDSSMLVLKDRLRTWKCVGCPPIPKLTFWVLELVSY